MTGGMETYLRSVIAAEGDPAAPPRRGLFAGALRGFLGGCAGLYDLGLELYLAGEHLGLRRRAHLPLPIVSVGNLSVGGTGKTPMVQAVCRALTAQGRRVAVLSRGHGGKGVGVRLVSDGAGDGLPAAEAVGDEPVLLARTLPGVPVLVGKDRRQSGREAMRRFGLDALVLDDGFQFWQLARDLDIVLLDALHPFDNGFPLPRGLLREPARHLRRAQIVVATRADRLEPPGRAALAAQVRRLAPQAALYFARHTATGLVPAADLRAEPLPLQTLRGRRVAALAGIAQPRAFLQTLSGAAGVDVALFMPWADHGRYGRKEVAAVRRRVRQCGAEALVMTEKDAVKWADVTGPPGESPELALRIEMALDDPAGFFGGVTARLFGKEAAARRV